MEYISHEDYKNFMSKFQSETPKGILKEDLDPVGQEDSDIDNDGDTDKTDKYLLNRRKAVGKAIKKGRMMKEAEYERVELVPDQIKTDHDLFKIVDLLRKKGIEAGTGARHHSDILVPFKRGKEAAEILAAAGYELKNEIGEYNYTDNYPSSWGYRESKIEEDDYTITPNELSGDTDVMNIAEDSELPHNTFKVKTPDGEEKVIEFDEFHPEERIDAYTTEGWVSGEDEKYSYVANASKVMGFPVEIDINTLEITPHKGIEEGLHTPPLQATGPTVSTVENSIASPSMGFSVLSPSEREQLKEYINSIREIKKEINKLVEKAGKSVKSEDMGGDRTGLVMTKSEMYEEHSPEIEKIEAKIPEKLYTVTEKVLAELKKAGLTDAEIQMFIKHEMEEIANQAIMGQYDLEEASYKVSKNSVPARSLSQGDVITSGEEVVSVSAGAHTPAGKIEIVLKNPTTGKERTAIWGKATMIGRRSKEE